MNDWWGLIWLVVLLLGNAFFVAAEFGIVSAKRSQIEPAAEDGKKSARIALHAMEHVSAMLAICQLGVTVCSLLLGNVAEPAIHHLLEGPLHMLGLPEAASGVIAFVLALAVVTYLHVVVGEMVPKNISLAMAGRAAMVLAPPLVFLSRVLSFVITPLNGFANLVLHLMRIEPKDEVNAAYTVEEVQAIVAESQAEGLLRDDMGLLQGALEFSDKTVAEVMVPMDQVVAINVGVTPADIERLVAQTGFSRYIEVDETGDPVSYLHIKDVLYADTAELYRAPVQNKRFRSLVTLRAADEIEDGLDQMRAEGNHVGRVLDADHRAVGVLFLEDVLEELVGEVHDVMQRPRVN
ncbi:hemolysin family protein [Brevibacterium moorei]|uniref:hemolysin family protein n=1 Tax=Brevibacterium moorei TaxID=2968457 RepID=UPI00211C3521|nr:hemolysin family protein [Brevibacterium sp. 68QC2CO]MCQ9384785.1 hemolysin family protein [Brevibacterium sp. 68QC2CO]